MKKSIRLILHAAVVAALYAALTLLPGISAVSYGPVQFRIAEALMLSCLYSPAAIAGVSVGCLLANLFSPAPHILDLVFGTLATLLAGATTYFLRCYFIKHKWLAPVPTIIFNSLIVGSYLPFIGLGQGVAVWLCIGTVAVGEAVVCYALGLPLTVMLEKYKIFKS